MIQINYSVLSLIFRFFYDIYSENCSRTFLPRIKIYIQFVSHTFFVLSLSNSLPLLELIAFMWTKRLVLRQRPLPQRYKMCYYEDFRVYLHISINFYLKVFHIKYSYHDINSIYFLAYLFSLVYVL